MTRRAGRAIGVRRGLMIGALASLFLPARLVFAHATGVSSGEYRLDGPVLYGDLGMADRELARWLPAIDTDHDGAISANELLAGKDAVERALAGGMSVTTGDRACPETVDRAWVQEGDGGAIFQLHFTCPIVPGRLALAMPLLDGLAPGHRHMARLFRAGQAEVAVLDRAHATWTPAGGSSKGALAWSMLKLGVEHILTGADHLVFLCGLILVGGRLRALVGVISAFTLAHSLTLALAVLSIFAPSPRLVEPAIALSIAYVGVENLFVKDASKRWRITFPFGLIHGFGFAGALREIALPRAQIPIALVSFNAGVELGQLAVLSLALPLALALRRTRWFGARGVKIVSVAIASGGVALFVARLVSR